MQLLAALPRVRRRACSPTSWIRSARNSRVGTITISIFGTRPARAAAPDEVRPPGGCAPDVRACGCSDAERRRASQPVADAHLLLAAGARVIARVPIVGASGTLESCALNLRQRWETEESSNAASNHRSSTKRGGGASDDRALARPIEFDNGHSTALQGRGILGSDRRALAGHRMGIRRQRSPLAHSPRAEQPRSFRTGESYLPWWASILVVGHDGRVSNPNRRAA